MPVVIHGREAHKDCMDILREHKVSEVGGVFHCYAGSVEMAKEILDWGMYIAFGGSLTFKKSVRLLRWRSMYRLTELLLKPIRRTLHPNRTEESETVRFISTMLQENLASGKYFC